MAKPGVKKVSAVTAPAASSGMAAPSSKTHAADLTFNEEIALLLKLASAAPLLKFPERKSAAKLFELAVLAELLLEYQTATKGTVKLVQPNKGAHGTFAGSPASANKDKYAWFELSDSAGKVEAEAWVSVQFVGLSAALASKHLAPGAAVDSKASSHELDLTLIAPEPVGGTPRLYPQHTDLLAAVSVKHVSSLAKESIREALGFRREMGFYSGGFGRSASRWLQANVPCIPPSPLFLVSSAENFDGYGGHIDQLGIYLGFMKFPY